MGNVYTKSGALARRIYFGATTIWENLYYFLQKRVLADGGTFIENDVLISDDGASLILTPNAYKVGKLYSAKPNFGAGDSTVDRNSTATYIGQDRLIKTALANVPRIDWSSGEAVVLRELQRTNLVTDSLIMNWTIADFNRLGNYAIAPDGTLTATKITVVDNPLMIPVTYFSMAKEGLMHSIYLKGEGENIGKTVSFANINTDITLTNEWVRYQGLSTSAAIGIKKEGNNTANSVLVWGAQAEQGSTATSYIPTNGVTETRLADNINVPTPAGVTAITETIDGVEQTPITTIPATYSLPVGNINKVTML